MIHESAIIEDGAEIGKNVSIGAFSYIGSGVKIGDNTEISTHCHIEGNTTIGRGNKIFSHAVLGSIPQDLKYSGEEVFLEIGDENLIREFTLINPGTKGGGGVTKIGDRNLLMGYVHIAHDAKVGNNCILANVATLAGHVELGNGVVIGGLTPVHQFVKIGDYAMIGGASALAQDVPPYCLAAGRRASIKGLNLIGLRRHFNREIIDELKRAYRALFESKKPLQEVATQLLNSSNVEEVKNLCNFIKNSKRGIRYRRDSDVE
jgi:UDP-N-acetylglucosamine acyltransferase